jgi:hypothetical protein
LEKANAMIRMVFKFVRSMARHQWAKWRGYEVLAPFGVQKWRNRKCDVCPFNEEGQCAKCKCLVLSKVVMALEHCPVRQWNAVWIRRRA